MGLEDWKIDWTVSDMSTIKWVQSTPINGTAIQCHDCEREEPNSSSFYDGPAAIAAHNADCPEHKRLTWLRREVA